MTTAKLLIFVAGLIVYGSAETVRVRASVHCGFQKRMGLPVIALLDEDFSSVPLWNLFDSDDLLDETKVEYGEHFTLDGSEIEVFSIEPYLRIRHRCFTMDREDILDLSQFATDPSGIKHIGRIILSPEGYKIHPFGGNVAS